MEFIIDLYTNLDTLDIIIILGIIIVIVLLIIFSSIILNKNKKLKKIVEQKNKLEELPIKIEELETSKNEEIKNIDNDKVIMNEKKETTNEENQINKTIETEKEFIVEEHIIGYNNKENENASKTETSEYTYPSKKEIEIPTKPYQRNVLREMSLSQTSPIGITKPIKKEDRKVEMAKELQESLNTTQNEEKVLREISKEEIKKELTRINELSRRKTEIISNHNEKKYEKNTEKQELNTTPTRYNYNNSEYKSNELDKIYLKPSEEKNKLEKIEQMKSNYEERKNIIEEPRKIEQSTINEDLIASPVKELLNSVQEISKSNIKSSSEKYLEEVSKKLSEAEIQDEIERTNYELEQEENAIISYTELMEKKDSIQTIDEEEAIISIEELMNRNNKQQEQMEVEENSKLYNISEEEENEEFLNQLKQFRNDL